MWSSHQVIFINLLNKKIVLLTIKKTSKKIFLLSLSTKLNTMLLSNLNAVFLIGMPGGSEWIFILLAVVLLFGGKKIPELMKGIGKGVRDFNDAKTSVKNEIEEGMKEKDKEQEIRELKQQLEQKRAAETQSSSK